MKPTFIGIGAQKCASSWLYEILRDHPEICLSREKEVNFFSYNFERGYQWYERHFGEDCANYSVVGEISPSYFHNPSIPNYVKQYNPDVKILLSLRDPVLRAVSNHKHDIRTGNLKGTDLSLKAGLKNNPSYVEQGLYATHIKRWLTFFPKDQILILLVDDISTNPDKVASDVYRFLGVSSNHKSTALRKQANKSYTVRWRWLSNLVNRIGNIIRHGPLHKIWWFAEKIGMKKLYHLINAKKFEESVVSITNEDKKALLKIFSKELAELETLLCRDLSRWKNY